MAKKQIATFLGGQLGLSTIKDHAYAYSGQIGTENTQSLTDMLRFTTGDYYLVGEWTVSGAINISGDSDTGGIDQFYLSFKRYNYSKYKDRDSPRRFANPLHCSNFDSSPYRCGLPRCVGSK